jgi:hypothetical protein
VLESILSVLKKKIDVQIMWLVYTPEKIKFIQKNESDAVILDIHNYKNALEVIEKEKPDLVYAYASWNFIDYALSSAAKFCSIPVFCVIHADLGYDKGIEKNISSNLTRFFQNSIPTDKIKNKKQPLRRGRFFLYKYFFLLQTMLIIKKNRLETIFTIWKFIFSDKQDPKFASNTIQFLENKNLYNKRISLGFNESNLIITGNPMYDSLFFTLQKLQAKNTKNNTKNVLLLTTGLYEHGIWTKDQRDYSIQKTLEQLKNMKNLNLTVKIHPSSEILSEYEQIIQRIIPNASVHQKGNIENFIADSDLVISFPLSTVLIYALLIDKPLIVCNYFNINDFSSEHDFIFQCKNPLTLLNDINKLTSSNLQLKKTREIFINEFLFKFDGHAKDRICDNILKLIKKKSKVT